MSKPHLIDKEIASASGTLARGVQVSISSESLIGLIRGAGNVQEALRRIDATGLGAPITSFSGNYTMTTTNRDEWLNRHVQGEDGQSCSRNRVVNLPSLVVLGETFDHLVTIGLSETITVIVSYFGCSSTSSLVNSLRVNPPTNVDNAPGGFGFTNNIVLNRADSVTLQISRVDGTIGSWEVLSRGVVSTESGSVLDDIQLQTRTWTNSEGTILPGSDDVLKGYAFRVLGSTPNDGTLRQGLIDNANPANSLDDRVLYDGDWVIWSADTFTSWLDGDSWFVMPVDDVRRFTQAQENFLAQTQENDTDNYVRIEDDANTNDEAIVWLVNPDNTLTTAPFLSPSQTVNPDPRNTPTTTYIGGRDDVDSNGDTTFDLSRFPGNPVLFEGEIIIGISAGYLALQNLNDVRIEILEQDGNFITSFNLNDNFVKPVYNDGSLSYFILSTFKISNSFTLYRYHSGQQIKITINRPDREFEFTEEVKIQDRNIKEGGFTENNLSQGVQAKLNKGAEQSPQDRARLDAIEETTVDSALPNDFSYMVKFGEPSHLQSDYRLWVNSNGLIQDFENDSVYTIQTPSYSQLTGFDNNSGTGAVTITELTPSLFSGTRTYRVTIAAAPDDINYNPLDHPVIFTGTLSDIIADGLNPSIKIDADNFEQAFLDSILNHDQALPDTLRVFNTQAEVFHFDNTDFVSNNEHAGVDSMFAFLKNRPDERLGDPSTLTASDLINEVTDSDITFTSDNLLGIFYPKTIGGEFDNGVDTNTNGALVGPGSVNTSTNIISPDANNFRLTLGFWFDFDPIAEGTIRNLIRVKEHGSATFRRLFGLEGTTRINSAGQEESGAVITERVQGSPGGTTTRVVTHNLYTSSGAINHTFSGVGAAEVLFRVNEAREYTFESRLFANGNDEGSSTNNVTIANINQDQSFGTHDFTYTVNGQAHTQQVTIEYVANDSTYGGPGHTLRFELLNGLNDNVNFDIDHLIVSCHYDTTETVNTSPTYAEGNAGGTPLLRSRKKHRCILSFRKNEDNDNLQCHYVVTGFDSNNNPVVSSSNIIDFNYSVFELDWTQTKLMNSNSGVAQNIQGFFLNTDTPLANFPTLSILNGWLTSHDDKSLFVWDNVSAPSRNVEAVRFPENVNLPNLIFEDTETTDTYKITIVNGVLTPVKVI